MDPSRHSGGWRKKIPIRMIEKKDALRETFSKRRQGLFNKASDLSVLWGVDVAVVAFSPAANPYCHTSTPSLIHRIFSASSSTSLSSSSDDYVDELWWEQEPRGDMSIDQLKGFRERLVEEIQSIKTE